MKNPNITSKDLCEDGKMLDVPIKNLAEGSTYMCREFTAADGTFTMHVEGFLKEKLFTDARIEMYKEYTGIHMHLAKDDFFSSAVMYISKDLMDPDAQSILTEVVHIFQDLAIDLQIKDVRVVFDHHDACKHEDLLEFIMWTVPSSKEPKCDEYTTCYTLIQPTQ
jgi:hypothetical protein